MRAGAVSPHRHRASAETGTSRFNPRRLTSACFNNLQPLPRSPTCRAKPEGEKAQRPGPLQRMRGVRVCQLSSPSLAAFSRSTAALSSARAGDQLRRHFCLFHSAAPMTVTGSWWLCVTSAASAPRSEHDSTRPELSWLRATLGGVPPSISTIYSGCHAPVRRGHGSPLLGPNHESQKSHHA